MSRFENHLCYFPWEALWKNPFSFLRVKFWIPI
jgi:hypothetical protein